MRRQRIESGRGQRITHREGKRSAEGKRKVGGGRKHERETESKDVLYQSRAADAVLRIENRERKHGVA